MLRVSELPETRWPPGADDDLHWPAALTTLLAFTASDVGAVVIM